MTNIEKYSWVPLVTLFVGLGIPGFLFEFSEESFDGRILTGIYSSMTMITYAVFKRLGDKHPELKKWAGQNLLGASVTMFSGGLFLSLSSNLFAALPFPNWLHFTIAVVIALVALFLLLSASTENYD